MQTNQAQANAFLPAGEAAPTWLQRLRVACARLWSRVQRSSGARGSVVGKYEGRGWCDGVERDIIGSLTSQNYRDR